MTSEQNVTNTITSYQPRAGCRYRVNPANTREEVQKLYMGRWWRVKLWQHTRQAQEHVLALIDGEGKGNGG